MHRTGGTVRGAPAGGAGRHALIGGDLYDIAHTPHGTRAPAGDVPGKGLPAIGTGVAALGAVREAVSRETRPANVAPALNAAEERYNTYPVQTGQRERFVTATVPRVQDGPQIAADNCGHPTPSPHHDDGRVQAVGLRAGIPPGLAAPSGQPRTEERLPWHADAVPVLPHGTQTPYRSR
ncbi:SpoIIE family protein phosphatase [Kitasatospora sp. NPDC048194]|uniref:SpoIIE family protein phosphatase n=1 Tax=Kitasatospora sp. NPDC048194 TaxID=3364045 RepID=UPI003717E813